MYVERERERERVCVCREIERGGVYAERYRESVYIYEKRLRVYFIVRLFVRYVCREIERECM